MTVASQINTSLNTITVWDTESTLPFFGQIFGKASNTDVDTAIEAARVASDWVTVVRLKKRAEHLGYSSATITTAVKAALDGISMFSNYKVPINYVSGGNWWIQERGVDLNCFRWSQELNYQTTKWNLQDCYDGLKTVRDAQSLSYCWCNPDTGAVYRASDGRSQYSALNGMQWLTFFNNGVTTALDEAEEEWSYFNTEYWLTDHYIYAPTWHNWEFCSPTHFFCWTKLHIKKGRALTNWNRLIDDAQTRYVANLWDSKQWGGGMSAPAPYGAAVHHNASNPERRLQGTLNAWIVLHTAYKKFSAANQTNMKNMLEGTGVTKASTKFMDADTGLFDSGTDKFKSVSGGSVSDNSTCYGCLTLFLLGISPQTGSLAIPIIADNFWVFDMNSLKPSFFKFDYSSRKIKIPVWAGEIKFTFGSSAASYTFPSNGVYNVTFASDWNSIIDVTKVSSLPKNEDYIDPVSSFQIENSQFTTLTNTFKNSFKGNPTFEVTRSMLSLGERDGTTGWYVKNYVDSTITMIIVQREAQNMILSMGYFVSLDALGFTITDVQDGDLITDSFSRIWEVKTVKPVIVGESVYYFKCDLKELPLYE